MPDSNPYTLSELADIRTRRIGNLDGWEQRRLLATVDLWKDRAFQRRTMFRDLLYRRTLPAEELAEARGQQVYERDQRIAALEADLADARRVLAGRTPLTHMLAFDSMRPACDAAEQAPYVTPDLGKVSCLACQRVIADRVVAPARHQSAVEAAERVVGGSARMITRQALQDTIRDLLGVVRDLQTRT
jgi:hypothetical protein